MRYLAFFLLVASLSTHPARASEPAAAPAAGIQSIALIRVPPPREVITMNKGSLAFAFGGLGAALVSLDAYTNQKGLLGALARTKFVFSEQLTQDLNEAVTARGFKTRIVEANRNERPDKLLDDYSAIQAEDADAILDVSLASLGYATEHFMFSPHWRPDVMVYASLVKRASSERLYEERIMYGLHNPFLSAAKLHAPREFQFADQDALDAADDAVLIGGLKDASKAIAAHVASKLLPAEPAPAEGAPAAP